jgi:hypothetical protein
MASANDLIIRSSGARTDVLGSRARRVPQPLRVEQAALKYFAGSVRNRLPMASRSCTRRHHELTRSAPTSRLADARYAAVHDGALFARRLRVQGPARAFHCGPPTHTRARPRPRPRSCRRGRRQRDSRGSCASG